MSINDVRVLVCDDSILSRKKLKDCVIAFGCKEAFEAADGEQAVEVYKEQKPDIVFMDIVMPNKDGIEAVKEIMAFDPSAKIVMASSVGTQQFLKDAIKAGASDFLQKPLDNDQVKRLLDNFIKEGE